MKTLKISFFLILGLLITLSSCEKDEPNEPNQPPAETAYNFEIGSNKTASFFGIIVDENNQVVSGAAISIGASSTTTDAKGVFFIENATVNENHAYIKAQKSGFFLGSRSVVPTNGVNTIKIMLLEKENIGSFDASAGGTVSGNGLSIDFQDGIVDASGNTYTGLVNVAAKYIDPESTDFFDYMPGNLIGANANGGNYLESFGMTAVELTDASGNELQPADGKEAMISFPLSSGLLASAPNTIPLWHFDEVKGYWVLEGEATLDGNVYKAPVGHFSFWNCDIPTDYVVLDGQIIEDTNALSGILVKIVSTGFGTGQALTDINGEFSGIVPANDNLTLEVYYDCGVGPTLIHSEVIGMLSSNTNLSPTAISTSGIAVSVTGTVVDCAFNPIAHGFVEYGAGGITYVTAGNFNILTCSGTSLDIKAYDIDNLTESGVNTYSISGSSVNVGQIVACNSLSEYIQWNVNGDEFLASSNFYFYEQGSFAGFNGNTPNNFSIEMNSFSGVGSYVFDNTGGNYISSEGIALINSGNVTLNITQYGTNSGDLIEGSFSGNITGVSPIDSSTVTQVLSGDIHFFRN